MTIDLESLERLLAEATPGEWRAVTEGPQPVCYYRALVCFSANGDAGGYISVVADDSMPTRGLLPSSATPRPSSSRS